MESSSVAERNNIRNNFVEKVKDKLESCQDLGEIDLYLYFNSLNKLDNKLLKEEKKKCKRDLLTIKLLLLKDKITDARGLDRLIYSISYLEKLMKEDLGNYQLLREYSKLCLEDYSVIDEGRYLSFSRYCNDFSNLTFSLVDDIKNRPSNSSLIPAIMRVEEEETYLRENNNDTILMVTSIIDDKCKVLRK